MEIRDSWVSHENEDRDDPSLMEIDGEKWGQKCIIRFFYIEMIVDEKDLTDWTCEEELDSTKDGEKIQGWMKYE